MDHMSTSSAGTPGFGYNPMDFGEALKLLKTGSRLARRGWNGQGQHIALQTPEGASRMKRPYIYIHPIDGGLVPWIASQTDLLATDWCVVN